MYTYSLFSSNVTYTSSSMISMQSDHPTPLATLDDLHPSNDQICPQGQ